MKKTILITLLLAFPLVCFAQDANISEKAVWHIILKWNEDYLRKYDVTAALREDFLEAIKENVDLIAVEKVQILQVRDVFVITCKTSKKPEEIISAIDVGNLPIPSELVTYFKCDSDPK